MASRPVLEGPTGPHVAAVRPGVNGPFANDAARQNHAVPVYHDVRPPNHAVRPLATYAANHAAADAARPLANHTVNHAERPLANHAHAVRSFVNHAQAARPPPTLARPPANLVPTYAQPAQLAQPGPADLGRTARRTRAKGRWSAKASATSLDAGSSLDPASASATSLDASSAAEALDASSASATSRSGTTPLDAAILTSEALDASSASATSLNASSASATSRSGTTPLDTTPLDTSLPDTSSLDTALPLVDPLSIYAQPGHVHAYPLRFPLQAPPIFSRTYLTAFNGARYSRDKAGSSRLLEDMGAPPLVQLLPTATRMSLLSKDDVQQLHAAFRAMQAAGARGDPAKSAGGRSAHPKHVVYHCGVWARYSKQLFISNAVRQVHGNKRARASASASDDTSDALDARDGPGDADAPLDAPLDALSSDIAVEVTRSRTQTTPGARLTPGARSQTTTPAPSDTTPSPSRKRKRPEDTPPLDTTPTTDTRSNRARAATLDVLALLDSIMMHRIRPVAYKLDPAAAATAAAFCASWDPYKGHTPADLKDVDVLELLTSNLKHPGKLEKVREWLGCASGAGARPLQGSGVLASHKPVAPGGL